MESVRNATEMLCRGYDVFVGEVPSEHTLLVNVICGDDAVLRRLSQDVVKYSKEHIESSGWVLVPRRLHYG